MRFTLLAAGPFCGPLRSFLCVTTVSQTVTPWIERKPGEQWSKNPKEWSFIQFQTSTFGRVQNSTTSKMKKHQHQWLQGVSFFDQYRKHDFNIASIGRVWEYIIYSCTNLDAISISMNMYIYIYRVIYGLKQTLCELLDEQISIKTGNFRYTLWTIHDAMAAMVGLNRSLLPLVWRLRPSLQTPAGAKVTADDGRSSLEGRKRGPMKLLGSCEQWLLDIPFISVM